MFVIATAMGAPMKPQPNFYAETVSGTIQISPARKEYIPKQIANS